jgi:hypothetical protein
MDSGRSRDARRHRFLGQPDFRIRDDSFFRSEWLRNSLQLREAGDHKAAARGRGFFVGAVCAPLPAFSADDAGLCGPEQQDARSSIRKSRAIWQHPASASLFPPFYSHLAIHADWRKSDHRRDWWRVSDHLVHQHRMVLLFCLSVGCVAYPARARHDSRPRLLCSGPHFGSR